MPRETACCFSGHRPSRLPWGEDTADPRCRFFEARLREALRAAWQEGFRHAICGMAQGADLCFCRAALSLREECPGLTVEAAVPYGSQAEYLAAHRRPEYERLIAACDTVTILQPHYSRGCLNRRNRYMVDHAALLIAAYDGTPKGGTFNTIAYAMREGVRTVLLDPADSLS